MQEGTLEIRKKIDRKEPQEISIISDKIVDHILKSEVKVVITPVKILPKKVLNSKLKLHMKPGKARKEATNLGRSGNGYWKEKLTRKFLTGKGCQKMNKNQNLQISLLRQNI